MQAERDVAYAKIAYATSGRKLHLDWTSERETMIATEFDWKIRIECGLQAWNCFINKYKVIPLSVSGICN